MAEVVVTLSDTNRLGMLQQAGLALDREASILEKDLWVCWALEALFGLELPMVFKGGTSRSKVYRAISRFSEDLDLTIDHRSSEAWAINNGRHLELWREDRWVLVRHEVMRPTRNQRVWLCFQNPNSSDGRELNRNTMRFRWAAP
jgi:hypothetical protein